MNQWPNSVRRLGERLKYLRTLKNLTQAELAQKLDISLRQYSRVERGESQPTITVLERICAVLDSCLSTLFLVFDAEGRSDCLKRAGRNQAFCGHSLTGMWALRNSSGPPRWSASLYQLLGYTPFSVKPTLNRFLKHVSPEDQSVVKTFIDAAKQHGNVENQFIHITTKSSEKRFVILSRDFFPGQSNNEEPYILVQDVTDQMLLDQSLSRDKEQLEKYVRERNCELELTLDKYQQEIFERIKAEEVLNIYKMMVRESNDPQIYLDNEGIIVIANTAYEKLLNMSAKEIVGKDYKTLISRVLGSAYYDLEIQHCLDNVFLREKGKRTYREGWRPGKYGRRFLSRTYTPCRDGEKITGVIITIHDITHLMIALDMLTESEARFRNLLANVPNVAVQGYRMDGMISYWNQASEQIYGFSAEEVMGRNIVDLIIPPGMRKEVKAAIRLMAHTGEPIPASEWWLMRKDGSLVPVYTSHVVVQKMGALPELFCIDIDLTKRKLAEEVSRKREQLLEVAASATLNLLHGEKLGPCITDILARLGHITNTDRVYVFETHRDQQSGALLTSQAYEWVRSGITPQIDNPDLQNINLEDFVPRWVKEIVSENVIMGLVRDFPEAERSILEPQEIQSLLAVPIKGNGEVRGIIGFDSVRSPRTWSDAEVNVLRIIATAIGAATTRKAMERTLRIKDQAITSSIDALLLADLDGRITYVNPAFLKLWGLEREKDALGRHVTGFCCDVYHFADVMRRVLEYSSVTERMIARRADKTPITVQSTTNIVRDDKGDPVCMMVSFRDMTEQMNHERELAEAKELAEAANRAKSDFLAKMSHEVRTPLNGIVGLVSLLADTSLDADQREYVTHIAASSGKMIKLLCSLLDLSKIEAGKIELENEPFSPRWIVEEVVNLMIPLARQKNLTLKWDITENVPGFLSGDMDSLRQILLNLVGNAMKFTDQGTVDVLCGLEMIDGARAMLRFTVKDTGTGIPADQINSLFSPYVRGRNVQSRYSGTGLGLAIAKELVELMGGEIRMESTEDEGSTFWFTAWFLLLEAVGEG